MNLTEPALWKTISLAIELRLGIKRREEGSLSEGQYLTEEPKAKCDLGVYICTDHTRRCYNPSYHYPSMRQQLKLLSMTGPFDAPWSCKEPATFLQLSNNQAKQKQVPIHSFEAMSAPSPTIALNATLEILQQRSQCSLGISSKRCCLAQYG